MIQRLMSKKRLSALCLLLVLIVTISLLYPPSTWVPAASWGAALEQRGALGMLVFVIGGVLATSVGLPRQMVAFIAGVAYGTLPALLLSLVAAMLGCGLTMQVARYYLSDWVASKYPSAIDRLQKMVEKDVFLKILILRLQPLGTNMLTNVCAGLARIPPAEFLIASAIGYVPQMFVFVLLGSGVRVGSGMQMMLSVVLFVVALLLGVYLYRFQNRSDLRNI